MKKRGSKPGRNLDRRRRSLSDPDSVRELVYRLQEGIYITNPKGEILDANPAMLEICGVSSLKQLQKLKATALVDPETRKRELALLQRRGSVQKFELEIRRPDGQVRTVIDSAHRTRDPKTGEVLYHGILVDITLRKRLESQLHEQSIRDPLTGCFNRRYLEDFEKRWRNRRKSWGCLAVDIDHFKHYNDRYGHQAGDDVLIRMNRFLMRQTRAEEGVVRTGGDEFVVLLPGADRANTEATARRLELAAKSEAPVPFSMGWAARRSGEKLERTIARADRSMLSIRLRRRSPGRDRRVGR